MSTEPHQTFKQQSEEFVAMMNVLGVPAKVREMLALAFYTGSLAGLDIVTRAITEADAETQIKTHRDEIHEEISIQIKKIKEELLK
jgi:hypothetical protein